MKYLRYSVLIVWIALLSGSPALGGDRTEISGTVHVHSTFSSGKHSLAQLVDLARTLQIDVLVVTDHDLVVMEYGLFPLRNLLRKRKERNSVLRAGPEKFLQEIERQNLRQKDVLLIPGVQSSPFYYWTGSPGNAGLVANNYRKEMLLVGMSSPEDYSNLPVLHRGLSTAYTAERLPRSGLFLAAFGLGVYLVFQAGLIRYLGTALAVFSLVAAINYHPFPSSRFDPYHGNADIEPYQEVIDYVEVRNGLVFWSHPESRYASKGTRIGPITLRTPPYPEALLQSTDYTGFAALYGDTTAAERPGRQWDQALLAYCRGDRSRPVWAIAESDFHGTEGEAPLNTFQTVFWVENKCSEAVLEALAKGRTYAVRKGSQCPRMILKQFELSATDSSAEGVSGAEIETEQSAILSVELGLVDESQQPVVLEIIKNGSIWKKLETNTPVRCRFVDESLDKGMSYYRLSARSSRCGRLLSNPIFVKKS